MSLSATVGLFDEIAEHDEDLWLSGRVGEDSKLGYLPNFLDKTNCVDNSILNNTITNNEVVSGHVAASKVDLAPVTYIKSEPKMPPSRPESKSASPMVVAPAVASAAAGTPCLQIVNGQLVVQAQLQQVHTATGMVTVAVLPSFGGLQMPNQQQLVIPQQISDNKTQTNKTVTKSTKKPAPRIIAPKPSSKSKSSRSSSNEGIKLSLNSEDGIAVNELNAQIEERKQMLRLCPQDVSQQEIINALEARRAQILQNALMQQQQRSSGASNYNRSVLPATTQPQIVQVNGQQYLMVQQSAAKPPPQQPRATTVTVTAPPAPAPRPQPVRQLCNAAKRHIQKVNDRSRLKERVSQDYVSLSSVDQSLPFSDRWDAINRLLPFHLHSEPDLSQEVIEKVDASLDNLTRDQMSRKRGLEDRFRRALLQQSLKVDQTHEEALLLYQLARLETDMLQRDKEKANEDLESFVRHSDLLNPNSQLTSPQSVSDSSNSAPPIEESAPQDLESAPQDLNSAPQIKESAPPVPPLCHGSPPPEKVRHHRKKKRKRKRRHRDDQELPEKNGLNGLKLTLQRSCDSWVKVPKLTIKIGAAPPPAPPLKSPAKAVIAGLEPSDSESDLEDDDVKMTIGKDNGDTLGFSDNSGSDDERAVRLRKMTDLAVSLLHKDDSHSSTLNGLGQQRFTSVPKHGSLSSGHGGSSPLD